MKKTRGLSECYVWMCLLRNKYKEHCCGSEIIFVRIRIRLFRLFWIKIWIRILFRILNEMCERVSASWAFVRQTLILFLKLHDKSSYNFKLFRILLENSALCWEIVNFIGMSFISDLELPGSRSWIVIFMILIKVWIWPKVLDPTRCGSGSTTLP